MANKKKLTMKLVDKRLDFLLKQVISIQTVIENTNKILVFYIEYKNDLEKFRKHLEEKNNESRASDSKESPKGDEKTSTGEQNIKGRESKTKVG